MISCHVLMPFRSIRHPTEPEMLFQFLLRCDFTFDTGDLHGRLDDLLLIFYKVKLRVFMENNVLSDKVYFIDPLSGKFNLSHQHKGTKVAVQG